MNGRTCVVCGLLVNYCWWKLGFKIPIWDVCIVTLCGIKMIKLVWGLVVPQATPNLHNIWLYVQKEIYLQRWAVTLGELLAVAASHQPAGQLRHVLNSCLNLWVTLNDILWKFQYISTGWLSYELTRLTCLQCFDAVGWAAGRASGL